MRASIWAAALLLSAAACGDAATSPAVDGEVPAGLTGGRGQAGGASTINPSVALANSTVRNCPRRCAFRLTDIDSASWLGAAPHDVTENAEVGFSLASVAGRWSATGGTKLVRSPGEFTWIEQFGMNGWGQMVGFANSRVVAWEPDGTPILLSDRPYGQPIDGVANAINDNSVIVGTSGGRAFRTQYQEGFRWLAGAGSGAADVNFKGQVVGYTTVGGKHRATLWAPDGTATDLGTLPGLAHSEATAISETGIVVGISTNELSAGEDHGWIWTADKGMKPLPPRFVPADVNHWGEVAGSNFFQGTCGVYYEGYGLLTLPSHMDTEKCEATSINSWGDVVGSELVEMSRRQHSIPTVWTWGGNEGRYGF